MAEKFLSKVYTVSGVDETRAIYDDWSASYEAEIGENGYATPGRIAAALAGLIADKSRPLLDYGCGTGLGGLALRLQGFSVIDGMDLSPEMLEQARAKHLYRHLAIVAGDAPPPVDPGTYGAIAAVGVIGSGAAPVSVLAQLLDCLAPGGLLAFSFNDHTLEDPSYAAVVDGWLRSGAAVERFREHGPHLPGIGLGANVYVIEKT
ncbi:class I SAM-dependent methyltransferase [Mesobacterium sp. TK19101]|uniref:Class I SAM-dependent methyltransferase n=1 Tax=Mesobacterium hydrothermale TaxID=3111907 RepID=A0ABU6HCP0_9RHOB|nr:class I SAM-dependent methyltransferase [Mesobacterium sp. TK19101]MEC3860220.1 class I SAM-dependent methyltransferase [Mesobacterium sp. TK19101]